MHCPPTKQGTRLEVCCHACSKHWGYHKKYARFVFWSLWQSYYKCMSLIEGFRLKERLCPEWCWYGGVPQSLSPYDGNVTYLRGSRMCIRDMTQPPGSHTWPLAGESGLGTTSRGGGAHSSASYRAKRGHMECDGFILDSVVMGQPL